MTSTNQIRILIVAIYGLLLCIPTQTAGNAWIVLTSQGKKAMKWQRSKLETWNLHNWCLIVLVWSPISGPRASRRLLLDFAEFPVMSLAWWTQKRNWTGPHEIATPILWGGMVLQVLLQNDRWDIHGEEGNCCLNRNCIPAERILHFTGIGFQDIEGVINYLQNEQRNICLQAEWIECVVDFTEINGDVSKQLLSQACAVLLSVQGGSLSISTGLRLKVCCFIESKGGNSERRNPRPCLKDG